jgi:hypothetical protein
MDTSGARAGSYGTSTPGTVARTAGPRVDASGRVPAAAMGSALAAHLDRARELHLAKRGGGSIISRHARRWAVASTMTGRPASASASAMKTRER